MGVLVEAISVIVRAETVNALYPGGVAEFEVRAPNRTFCSDGHLVRVGFMARQDVKAFVASLQTRGFAFHDGDAFVDVAVVDQMHGPTARCPWLRTGRHPLGFSVAWLKGTSPSPMAAPMGWEIEQSSKLKLHLPDDAGERLLPLAREGMVEVLLDLETGKEVRTGRTTLEPPL
jgi:hypothetical protein